MDVYTLLLERNGHQTNRTAYVVYYFPVEGKLHLGFPFDIAVHHIVTDPVRAYEIFSAGCRCLAGPMPESGPQCEFCRWADTRLPTKQHPTVEGAGAFGGGARAPVPPAHSVVRHADPATIPDDLFA
jgi:hypothetical protein